MSMVAWLFTVAVFWLLMGRVLRSAEAQRALRRKPWGDWLLDLTGLLVQGVGVPLLQVLLVAVILRELLPDWSGRVALPGNAFVAGFLINVVVVDYLYYWNHRLLHTRLLWPVHRVHHTLTAMDVLGTSRNTVWSSAFIVYLWVNGALIFFLEQPAGVVAGATLTAALDLWRHSASGPQPGSALHRALSPWLILPEDHAWHHADAEVFGNYGANLVIWDRLHGTLIQAPEPPRALGVARLPLWRELLWPFGGKERS